jgi:hypothetical protein
MFENTESWDADGAQQFSDQSSVIMDGAQNLMTDIVDTFMTDILNEIRGTHSGPKGVRFEPNLRGVPSREVYKRPYVEVWSGLKDGLLFEDAKQNGLNRLAEIADDDLSLAYRTGAQKSMVANKITKFRRVVRPELSKGGTCPLCHLASGNTYNRSTLLPIHTHCRCAVMPIVGTDDPGSRLNSEDLGSLEVPKEEPVIRNHGELGPILQVAGQHFTSDRSL